MMDDWYPPGEGLAKACVGVQRCAKACETRRKIAEISGVIRILHMSKREQGKQIVPVLQAGFHDAAFNECILAR